MKRHEYWVYILECCDGSYYVGVTNDLDRRVKEHQDGLNEGCYTFKRRPLKLKYYEIYSHINDAIDREKQLKGWTRAKKEAIMRDDIPKLKALAKGPLSDEWLSAQSSFGCAQDDSGCAQDDSGCAQGDSGDNVTLSLSKDDCTEPDREQLSPEE